jgi:hypothetical protein
MNGNVAIAARSSAEVPEATPRNPYVGPASFKEGRRLYGRDRELRELTALILADNVVLLHSPSGAGKTSLLQSGLTPQLRKLGYHVLPSLRVGLQPRKVTPRTNRYLASATLSLDAARPPWAADKLDGSARQTSLQAYLEELRDLNDQRFSPQLLIFDQFEEILTLDRTDADEKKEFFVELGAALRNSNCSAVFAVREEWLGDLEPYLSLLAARSPARFRLELLRPDAAREAIVEPARAFGVTYSDEALAKLLHGLREEKVRTFSGTTEPRLGAFIEPVELQVVCHRLWRRFDAERGPAADGAPQVIGVADIEKVGSIGTILKVFYADTVAAVAEATGTQERTIREWIAEHLIAPGGIRNQVLAGQPQTEGLANTVLSALADARIVRAEHHGGRMWYEITHDSLVEPIVASNRVWDAEHATWLLRKARIWEATDNEPQALLNARQVVKHLRERLLSSAARAPLSELEARFLRQSHQRFGRRAVVALAIYAAIAGVGLWFMSDYWNDRAFRVNGRMIFELENELYSRTTHQILRTPNTGPPPGDRQSYVGREVPPEYLDEQRRAAAALLPDLMLGARPTTVRRIVLSSVRAEASAASFRRQGFNVVHEPVGNRIPNAITFGDSVPLEQVRLVALQMTADGVFVKRLRRFRKDEQVRDIMIHYDDHVPTWAPLPAAEIARMVLAPPAS